MKKNFRELYMVVENRLGSYLTLQIKKPGGVEGKITLQGYFRNKNFYVFIFALLDDS